MSLLNQGDLANAQAALAAAQFERANYSARSRSAWRRRLDVAALELANAQGDHAFALATFGSSDARTIAANTRATSAQADHSAALAAPVDCSADDLHTLATLDLRVSQAQAAYDAVQAALTG